MMVVRKRTDEKKRCSGWSARLKKREREEKETRNNIFISDDYCFIL